MKKIISQQKFAAVLALFPIVAGLLRRFTRFSSGYTWREEDNPAPKSLDEYTDEQIRGIADYVKRNSTDMEGGDSFQGVTAKKWCDIVVSELYRREFERMYNILLDKLAIEIFEEDATEDDCQLAVLEIGPALEALMASIEKVCSGSFKVEGMGTDMSIKPLMEDLKQIVGRHTGNAQPVEDTDVPLKKKRSFKSLSPNEQLMMLVDTAKLKAEYAAKGEQTVESSLEIAQEMSDKYNVEIDMNKITNSGLPRREPQTPESSEGECDCGMCGVDTIDEYLAQVFPEGSPQRKGQDAVRKAIAEGAEVKIRKDGIAIRKSTVSSSLDKYLRNFLNNREN